MIVLAVPVLNRYDLLQKLFESIARSELKPDRVLVIDNGDKYEASGWPDVPYAQSAEIIRPGRNIGVAAAWNLALDACGGANAGLDDMLVMVNDDVELGPKTLSSLLLNLTAGLSSGVVLGLDWSLWAAYPEGLVSFVGYFDENFFPAYFEDNDFAYRMKLREQRAAVGLCAQQLHVVTDATHVGSATMRHLEGKLLKQHHERFRKNREYYVKKWGGEPGKETFEAPFNGATPPGWRLRPVADPAPQFRYDAINQALRHLKKSGTQSYLEIGVSDGDCLRRVKADHKVGVDPDGQAASLAHEFYAVPSDEFFKNNLCGLFDVIFIDGLHTAEQVLLDVTHAWASLKPGGLILLHDCSPRDEAMQRVPREQVEWTGNVWRTVVMLARLSEQPELAFELCVLDTDYGVGVIAPSGPFPMLDVLGLSAVSRAGMELLADCSYQHFDANRKALLHLIHPGDFGDWLRRVRP